MLHLVGFLLSKLFATMNPITSLLARHVIAIAGAALEHHGISANSTTSIVFGAVMLLVPLFWSFFAKLIHIDEATGYNLTRNDAFRTALQVLLSKGIAVLSVWLACDADNPTLLLATLANAAASHFGIYQRLAFLNSDTLKALASKVPVLITCLILASCAGLEKRTGMTSADLFVLTVEAVQRYEAATKATQADIKAARASYAARPITVAKQPVSVDP